MGQKVHPLGFRLGYIKTWSSKWYGGKHYGEWLHEDLQIKKIIKERLFHTGVGNIEIERAGEKLKVSIYTSRPGIVIGRRGTGIENLKKALQKLTDHEVYIDIIEIRKPELCAQLVAENIALQLERRVAFRRAIKKAIASAMKLGAKGIKIRCAGRLGGAEMSRKEGYKEGRIPLHTLRADIDYGLAEAKTTHGVVGVKTWIFKGEILPSERKRER
jgi:small subunit ribosomal protein S3